MLASKIYYINSEERQSGSTDNFSFVMSIPESAKFDRVCVLQASIPQSYYIVASLSNTFTLTEKGVNTIVTIPVGNYSVLSFASVVQTLLTSLSPNGWVYHMAYPSTSTSANTGKYTFSVTGNGSFQPSFSFTNEMHEQFGFSLGVVYPFVGSSLMSANVVSFVPETRVFIHSDIGINHDDGDSVLQEIYGNNTIPLSMMSYQLTTDPSAYSKQLRSDKHNVYNFWLTDKGGNQILLNGQDIMITLLLYKRDNFTDFFKSYIQHQMLLQN